MIRTAQKIQGFASSEAKPFFCDNSDHCTLIGNANSMPGRIRSCDTMKTKRKAGMILALMKTQMRSQTSSRLAIVLIADEKCWRSVCSVRRAGSICHRKTEDAAVSRDGSSSARCSALACWCSGCCWGCNASWTSPKKLHRPVSSPAFAAFAWITAQRTASSRNDKLHCVQESAQCCAYCSCVSRGCSAIRNRGASGRSEVMFTVSGAGVAPGSRRISASTSVA